MEEKKPRYLQIGREGRGGTTGEGFFKVDSSTSQREDAQQKNNKEKKKVGLQGPRLANGKNGQRRRDKERAEHAGGKKTKNENRDRYYAPRRHQGMKRTNGGMNLAGGAKKGGRELWSKKGVTSKPHHWKLEVRIP